MDELLSILQSSYFDFEIFQGHLTTRKRCFRFVSEQKGGQLKSARFNREVMEF